MTNLTRGSIAALVAAVVTLALSIPPVVVPWATGDFRMEPYTRYGGYDYDGPAELTIWGFSGNAIPENDRMDAHSISLRFTSLELSDVYLYGGPVNRPCYHIDWDEDSTSASTIVARARATQAMVIIVILAAAGLVAVAGLRVGGILKRRPAIIATAVTTFLGLGAGTGAIVSFHLLYTSCGWRNLCEVMPILAIEDTLHVALNYGSWWAGCKLHAGLPVLAVAMAGFIVSLVITAVTKDRDPATDPERVGMVKVNAVDSESELEETEAPSPGAAEFVLPVVPAPMEKRPLVRADYNADDDPYAADYA